MKASEGEIKCKLCDKKHPRSKEKCPAWGRKCAKCGRMNHFAVKCDRKDTPKNKTKSVKLVDSYVTDTFHNTDSDDSMLMLDCVNHIASQSKSKLFVHRILF